MELLRLAIPILLSNWLYSVQSLVTLAVVSAYGEDIIAGVGFASTLVWLLYSLHEGVYAATATVAARRVGEGRGVGEVLAASLLISAAVAAPFSLFGEEAAKLFLESFSVKGKTLEAALSYLRPVLLAAPLLLWVNTLNAVFTGAGKSRAVFWSTGAVFISGTLLLLLLVPRLGAEGAGLAVVASELTGGAVYLLKLRELPLKPGRGLSKGEVRLGLKVGLPAAAESLLSSVSFNLFSGVVAACGTAPLAGYQLALRVEGFATALGYALLEAAVPFVGAAGGKMAERAREAVKVGLISGAAAGAVLLLTALIRPVDGEAGRWFSLYLLTAAAAQPAVCGSFAATGALRATGLGPEEAAVNVGSYWLFRLLPAWLAVKAVKTPLIPWGFAAAESWLRFALLRLVLKVRLRWEAL